MRIDNARSQEVETSKLARTLDGENSTPRSRGVNGGSGVSDQVANSGSSGLLALALELNSAPSSKVAALQQAIETGTYVIDAPAVSRAMLRSDRLAD